MKTLTAAFMKIKALGKGLRLHFRQNLRRKDVLGLSNWIWLGVVIAAGFLAYELDQPSGVLSTESTPSASTLIPVGFVLVPIEVSNFESLDSILGKYGVVDLYLPGDGHSRRPIKIGHHLKILRAPLNPSRFAVLAKESESADLVAHAGPFIAVIQNTSSPGTGIVKPTDSGDPKARSSRITVEMNDGHES